MQSFLIEALSPDSESPSSSTTSLDSITQTTLARTISPNPFRNPPPLPRRDASGSTVPSLPPRTSSQASQSIDIENWKTAALNALNDLDEKRPDGQDVDSGSVGHAPELPDHLGMHTCVVCDVPTVACCPVCSQVSYCSREHMEKVRLCRPGLKSQEFTNLNAFRTGQVIARSAASDISEINLSRNPMMLARLRSM